MFHVQRFETRDIFLMWDSFWFSYLFLLFSAEFYYLALLFLVIVPQTPIFIPLHRLEILSINFVLLLLIFGATLL